MGTAGTEASKEAANMIMDYWQLASMFFHKVWTFGSNYKKNLGWASRLKRKRIVSCLPGEVNIIVI